MPLSNALSFKGLFVYSVVDENRNNTDFTFINDPEALVPTGGDTRDEKATEKILRGTFVWDSARTQSLEIGVEGAINTLDKVQTFFDIVGGKQIDLEQIQFSPDHIRRRRSSFRIRLR